MIEISNVELYAMIREAADELLPKFQYCLITKELKYDFGTKIAEMVNAQFEMNRPNGLTAMFEGLSCSGIVFCGTRGPNSAMFFRRRLVSHPRSPKIFGIDGHHIHLGSMNSIDLFVDDNTECMETFLVEGDHLYILDDETAAIQELWPYFSEAQRRAGTAVVLFEISMM